MPDEDSAILPTRGKLFERGTEREAGHTAPVAAKCLVQGRRYELVGTQQGRGRHHHGGGGTCRGME